VRRQRADDRPQRQRREAADRVDAAREVPLEDGHAARVAAGHHVDLALEPEHERAPDRVERPGRALVAREGVLRQRDLRVGDLGGEGVVPAAAREHAIVARVVRQRRAQRRGDPGAEQVGDPRDRRGSGDGRRPEQRAERVRTDAHLLELVGEEQAQVLGQEVPPGEARPLRRPDEGVEELVLAEQVEAERPVGVEEVEVLVLEEKQLPEAGELGLQRQERAAPEQVVL